MRYNVPSPLETRIISQRFDLPNSASIDTYLANDGYVALRKAIGMAPEAIIDELRASSLRGRGGAGFPTGMKWSFVPRNTGRPSYIICNSDESEPCTCKDRLLMENDPQQLIEGMLIAGWTIQSSKGYIFIRGEYRYQIEIMERAIAEAYERGYLGKNVLGTGWDFDLYTHSGAGAYECGEETALLESLEGKRGVPRLKPPFPAVAGAFQSPTILNNTETLSTVPVIIRMGGADYAALGTPKNGGTRLMCVSGHVNKPGVYELPLGFPLMRLINDVCGGMRNRKKLKAVIPGGSSAPVLKAEECDIPLDFDSIAKAKSMAGSGGILVLDEDTDMVAVALRTIKFYAHESCGWCIPCREGTTWLKKVLTRFHDGGGRSSDIDLIAELANNMLGRTFCALGDAAAMPTAAFVAKFRDEFEAYLKRSSAAVEPELAVV
ncbi:MAG: NADH-quinone oxidoreductase subunit NuoF [Acidobacteriaceae bacterium]|nr:NADH-quinone oxidoreductase subunit NuoF [Acidobacteriaceae bacterium]MBV9779616.1 NADH-quinone oxidoreductase subunit NuoF [Acidobacteriaceae bacterium]